MCGASDKDKLFYILISYALNYNIIQHFSNVLFSCYILFYIILDIIHFILTY